MQGLKVNARRLYFKREFVFVSSLCVCVCAFMCALERVYYCAFLCHTYTTLEHGHSAAHTLFICNYLYLCKFKVMTYIFLQKQQKVPFFASSTLHTIFELIVLFRTRSALSKPKYCNWIFKKSCFASYFPFILSSSEHNKHVFISNRLMC